jgi:3-oxo-5-alpha-steroid 4-dehydrogenase 3
MTVVGQLEILAVVQMFLGPSCAEKLHEKGLELAHTAKVSAAMDPALLCRMFFTTGAVVAIGGTLVPSFQQNIMNYGSRKRNIPAGARSTSRNVIESIIDFVASIQVPHSWFMHYYVVSVLSSLFWGYQISQHGKIVQLLATYSKSGNTSMTVNQVVLAWAMMLFQGLRRLYESAMLTKTSQSKMWVGLWIIGSLHYVCIGICVWIDGICKCP